MRDFIEFVRRESDASSWQIVVLTAFSGLVNGLIVALAIEATKDLEPGAMLPFKDYFLFVSALLVFWLSKQRVLDQTIMLMQKIIARIRLRVMDKMRLSDLLSFERLDQGNFLSVLTTDAMTISTSAWQVINAGSSVAMILFAVAYIAYLSMHALVAVAGLTLITVLFYLQRSKHVDAQLEAAAVKENEYYDNLRGLLQGFKELKLDRNKADDYFGKDLCGAVQETTELRIEAGKTMNNALLIGQSFNFLAIGVILFVLPAFESFEPAVLPSVIAVVLFAAGPIGDVVIALPALARANAAINNLKKLESLVESASSPLEKNVAIRNLKPLAFQRIECTDLSFVYPENGTQLPFELKPFHFTLERNEIVFIVGGNGSGKSTFLKLFCGLYQPAGGAIRLNGELVKPDNIATYRNLFATIFTDFYLFPRVLGDEPVHEELADRLLNEMQLAEKTQIVGDHITNRNLSTGQRKRLALILSQLEDKPIYVFDEWAADQDPTFRRYFYHRILQDLKAQGKTILAVTHDDHYFSAADRVLKMEYGAFLPGDQHQHAFKE